MMYIDDRLRKNIFLVSGIICIAAVFGLAAVFRRGKPAVTAEAPVVADPVPDEFFVPAPESWAVYVTGEVMFPGVYEIKPGSRVNDAINLAGGFSVRADRDAVNLAAKLRDEAHITVPAAGAAEPAASGAPSIRASSSGPRERSVKTAARAVAYPGEGSAPTQGLIDINSAGASELTGLPGIGPSLSSAIVAYREENGPFGAIDDLRLVRGIGEKRLEAIRGLVTVAD
jgi:competence protein ComEA